MDKTGKQPSHDWRSRLIFRAELVGEAAKTDFPPRLAANGVGLLIVAARHLYGRELIDKAIEEIQVETDAMAQGLCMECRTKPVTEEGYGLWCSECGAKHKASEAAQIRAEFDERNAPRN